MGLTVVSSLPVKMRCRQGKKLLPLRISFPLATLCGCAALILWGCSARNPNRATRSPNRFTVPSNAEVTSSAQEIKHLAAEDVMLRHGCDDGEYVESTMRDYQKAPLCKMCREGKSTFPVSNDFTVQTCSACGDHGVVVNLSSAKQQENCNQIPGLEQRTQAAEGSVDRLELSVSGQYAFQMARGSAEDLWQCEAGNQEGCRALAQIEQTKESPPQVIQPPPTVIIETRPVPMPSFSQPPAPVFPSPPVFTNCTNFGPNTNCITH